MADSLSLKPKRGDAYSLYLARQGVDGKYARSLPLSTPTYLEKLNLGLTDPNWRTGGILRKAAPYACFGLIFGGGFMALQFAYERAFKRT